MTTPLPELIARAQAHLEKITPGPWTTGATTKDGNVYVGQYNCNCCPENPMPYGDLIADVGPNDAAFVADAPDLVRELLAHAIELKAMGTTVRAFIDERPEYITALKNVAPGGSDADYWRWSGGAEARRQLAERLSWTVPHIHGDTTGPKPEKGPADA